MNPTPNHPPLTRKEISMLLGGKISDLQIARREKAMGLDKARLRLGTRRVLYHHSMTVAILRNLGAEL